MKIMMFCFYAVDTRISDISGLPVIYNNYLLISNCNQQSGLLKIEKSCFSTSAEKVRKTIFIY